MVDNCSHANLLLPTCLMLKKRLYNILITYNRARKQRDQKTIPYSRFEWNSIAVINQIHTAVLEKRSNAESCILFS